MFSKLACPAGFRPLTGFALVNGAPAQARFASSGARRYLGLTAIAALVALQSAAMAAPAIQADTDNVTWRATHGLLLGLARAGARLVAVGNDGHVLLSDDEGKSWRLAKTPTEELLTAVVFPTPTEGWAVGQDEEILHSTDAGETWTQQHIAGDSDQALFTIISLTPQHLFASGAYNLIEETQDGGATWKDSKIDNLDDDYHLNCAVARGNDILVTGEA